MSCIQNTGSKEIKTRDQWLASGMSEVQLEWNLNHKFFVYVACPGEEPPGPGEPPTPKPTGTALQFHNLFQGEMVTVQNLLMLVIVNKILKMPGGLKVLQSIAQQFIKGMFSSLHALGQASAANKVAAWANPYLISLVMERFGFVDGWRMPEYRIGLSVISGASVAESMIDTFQGIFPFSTPEPSEYPSQIVFSKPETSLPIAYKKEG